MGPSIKGSLWGQWKAKQCVLCSQLGALARGRLRTGLRTVLSGGPPTEAARRFSQDLSLPLLTQRQTKLESEQPPPGPISHSHPWASGRLHRPYPTSCVLTGPSHAGSRTGSLIHSHRQDDKPAARTEVHVDLTLFSLLPHMPKWRNSPSLSLGSPAQWRLSQFDTVPGRCALPVNFSHPDRLFSGSFLRFGRSKHIQISSQCICAGHGKSGARGSRGQLWVQPRAVGRSPAKSRTLPLAKRKRVCLFFFNVSFRETKRTRPSHTEASVRPVHLKTLYTAPFLAPASCPGSSEVHQACYRMSS